MFKGNTVIALLLCVIVGQLTWSYAQSRNSRALTAQDYAEIQQLYARYNFAVDAIDGEGVAAVYTPDGIFYEGKNRQIVGHDAWLTGSTLRLRRITPLIIAVTGMQI